MTIPEQPGSFKAFCEAIGKRQITEFNYRYHTDREAHIFVGVQTHGQSTLNKSGLGPHCVQGFGGIPHFCSHSVLHRSLSPFQIVQYGVCCDQTIPWQ